MTQTQEAKHTPTPGPWTWDKYVGGDAQAAACRAAGMEPTMALNNDGATYVMGNGELIATVALQAAVKKKELWHAEDGERDANARQIAAAPALLAACKTALMLCEMEIVRDDAGVVDRIRAAIALAEKGLADA